MDNQANILKLFILSIDKLKSQLNSISQFVDTLEQVRDSFDQYKYNGIIN